VQSNFDEDSDEDMGDAEKNKKGSTDKSTAKTSGKGRTKNFRDEYGVERARGCEVYAILDSEGNILEAVDWNAYAQREVQSSAKTASDKLTSDLKDQAKLQQEKYMKQQEEEKEKERREMFEQGRMQSEGGSRFSMTKKVRAKDNIRKFRVWMDPSQYYEDWKILVDASRAAGKR
tara:strand:- start:1782 stop:2306 length:525 start_codon:yes stop_codon:yes gene_type:complete